MSLCRRIATLLAATCCIVAFTATAAQASKAPFAGGLQFSLGAAVVENAPDIAPISQPGSREYVSQREFALAA
jgi:hypothetical protein